MKKNVQLITALFCLAFGATPLHAASGVWAHSGPGTWDDPANWSGSVVADGAGNLATFTMNITANTPVTLANPHTIGTVTVQDTSGNQLFSFLGAGILTLDNGASVPKLRALSGGVVIDFNVVLAGNNGVALPDKAGTISFSAVNTYSGDTVIESQNATGGTLRVNNVNAIPHGPGKGNVTLSLAGNGDGILDLNGLGITINGLSGGATSGIVKNRLAGTVTLTVGDNNATSTFSGAIQGVANNPGEIALTKIGNGTLTLNGQNTYSGATTVSAGTLLASGSLAGPVTVAAAGSFGAGAGAASLTLQNGMNLSSGGTFVWELSANSTNSPGVNFDQTTLSGGNLVLGGSSKLSLVFTGGATVPNVSDPFWQAPHAWTICSLGGSAVNPGLSRFTTLISSQYPSLKAFTQSADARGNIVLAYDPTTIFYALYDGGPGFFGGENLILTNTVGQTIHVWSSANPGQSVTNWNPEGVMAEQPLNDGTGNSRYSINVTPAGSPGYYIAVKSFGGAYPATVPVLWITVESFGGYGVLSSNIAINAAGILNLPALPEIAQQPVGKIVLAGKEAGFTVAANSFTPMNYQWYFNTSTLLPGATSSTVKVSAIPGAYHVVVANTFGSVTSSVANLTVLPLPKLTAQKVAGGFQLSGFGVPGDSYWVQTTPNLNPPLTWTTVATNVAGPDGLAQFVDANATVNPQKFFRLVFP